MAATGSAMMAPMMPASAKPMVISTSTLAPLKLIVLPWNVGTRIDPPSAAARAPGDGSCERSTIPFPLLAARTHPGRAGALR